MMAQEATPHASETRRTLWIGYAAIALFASTLGVWSATSPISGAVIGSGQFVVEGNLRKVQHSTGGIIAELLVREGSTVAEGDLLVRLDETVSRASLAIVSRQLDEMAGRAARLEAERDQRPAVEWPAHFATRKDDPEAVAIMANERHLFEARAQAREGQRSQLSKRIIQLRHEIEGYRLQHDARIRQADMIQRELRGVRDLFKQNLVQITRLSQLEREAASLDGQQGQLLASIAQSEGKIAETELQIIQLTEDLRAEALRELREIQSKMAELRERQIAAADQLKRTDIRAPVAGMVHQLAVHTVGGVISPAEPAMLIVPLADRLQLDVRIPPTDVDQLRIGQPAVVKIHAFNQRTTPELRGVLERISSDVVREAQTGQTYYTARVRLEEDELKRIAPLKIIAGMMADVFVETEQRTALSYVTRPLTDQLAKAFRER